MRNSHNITITESDTFAADDETTVTTGAVVGFIAWLLALGFPCLMYGPNTLFFFIYTALFLALLPVAIVAGIALHSLLKGRLLLSITCTLLVVGAMFGALFLWLLG